MVHEASNLPESVRGINRRSALRLMATGSALAFGVPLLASCSKDTAADSGNSAAAGGDFKLGIELPSSGNFASIGEQQLNGINLYLNSVGNKAGSIGLTTVVEDEVGQADIALTKAKKLVQSDSADAIMGIVSSADALAIRDYIKALQRYVLIVTNGSTDALLAGDAYTPYVFRTNVQTSMLVDPLSPWAYKNIGPKAAIICPDYTQGHDSADLFKKSFQAVGGTIAAEMYPPQGTADYQPFISKLTGSKADFIFTSHSGTDALALVKQLDQFGVKKDMKICGLGSLTNEDILAQEGSAALGIYTLNNWVLSLDTPTNKKFVSDYNAAYKSNPSAYAMAAYDAAHALIEAMTALGTADKAKDAKQLIGALETVSFESPRGPFKFAEKHDVVQNVYVVEVKEVDGKPTNVVSDTIKDVQPKS